MLLNRICEQSSALAIVIFPLCVALGIAGAVNLESRLPSFAGLRGPGVS
jgi:hypothetical protein